MGTLFILNINPVRSQERGERALVEHLCATSIPDLNPDGPT